MCQCVSLIKLRSCPMVLGLGSLSHISHFELRVAYAVESETPGQYRIPLKVELIRFRCGRKRLENELAKEASRGMTIYRIETVPIPGSLETDEYLVITIPNFEQYVIGERVRTPETTPRRDNSRQRVERYRAKINGHVTHDVTVKSVTETVTNTVPEPLQTPTHVHAQNSAFNSALKESNNTSPEEELQDSSKAQESAQRARGGNARRMKPMTQTEQSQLCARFGAEAVEIVREFIAWKVEEQSTTISKEYGYANSKLEGVAAEAHEKRRDFLELLREKCRKTVPSRGGVFIPSTPAPPDAPKSKWSPAVQKLIDAGLVTE